MLSKILRVDHSFAEGGVFFAAQKAITLGCGKFLNATRDIGLYDSSTSSELEHCAHHGDRTCGDTATARRVVAPATFATPLFGLSGGDIDLELLNVMHLETDDFARA